MIWFNWVTNSGYSSIILHMSSRVSLCNTLLDSSSNPSSKESVKGGGPCVGVRVPELYLERGGVKVRPLHGLSNLRFFEGTRARVEGLEGD